MGRVGPVRHPRQVPDLVGVHPAKSKTHRFDAPAKCMILKLAPLPLPVDYGLNYGQ